MKTAIFIIIGAIIFLISITYMHDDVPDQEDEIKLSLQCPIANGCTDL